MSEKIKKVLSNKWEVIVLLLFFGFLFFDLLSSHILLNINGNLYSSGSTWGDLPYHLTLINSFKERGLINTLKSDPIYLGEKLRYPFIFDYLSTLLIKIGLSLRWAIIIPSFLGLIILIYLIYLLALKITKKRWAAFLAPFLFVFNGSIFGLYYFFREYFKTDLSLIKFLNNQPFQFTHLSEHHIEFSNLIADFLLPQRVIIFGLIFTCLALIFIWNYWETKKVKNLFWAGVVIGLMPFIHTHLFLALIIFCFSLFIIQWLVFKEFKLKDWVICALPVIVLSIGPVLWLFPLNNKSFFRFQLGWMTQGEFFWWFWLKNLGLYFIFLILTLIKLPKLDSHYKITSFYGASLILFVLPNIFVFQPWVWDNMKIFVFWFLLSVIIIAFYLNNLWERKNKIVKLVVLVLVFLTIIPGLITAQRERTIKYVLYTPADQELANFVLKNTKPTDIFLTTDKHNNPVSSLAGRQIIMGYDGWLWSRGINYQERRKEVLEIFQGTDDAYQLISKYNPHYILVDKKAAAPWIINYSYFRHYFNPVFDNSDYTLYKIQN